MLDSFLPKKKEGLAGQVEWDDCWLWVNPVPVRCLVVRQKTTAAAEDNQRQQAAETWAQLLAQQYSLIIPRGSTAETHKQRSCSSATVEKTEWWGEKLTPSVLIVSVQLAVERIIHNSFSCPESANQSNFPELGEANSSDALRTLSNCVNACVHVFPGITADQSKSFKGGERGGESDGANEHQGWMQRGWNGQRKDTGYGCTGVERRMRVQNEKGWRGKKRLTLKMKSLLVHSDGECAVVLVIDSNHSSLGKQRDWERERQREGERGDTSHSHFPFLSSCPPHCTLPFINYPLLSQRLTISSPLSISFS